MVQRIIAFIKFQFPAIVWAGLIFQLSSIPSEQLPEIRFEYIDKIGHLVFFFVLTGLTHRALVHQSVSRWLASNALPSACIVATVYGVFDEFHQMFVPNRSPDVYDIVADFLGAVLYAMAFTTRQRRAVSG